MPRPTICSKVNTYSFIFLYFLQGEMKGEKNRYHVMQIAEFYIRQNCYIYCLTYPPALLCSRSNRGKAYLDGPLEGLLNIQPLAHDGLIQLPFKCQQIHVSLRLGDQFPDLGHCNEKDRLRTTSPS